MLKIILSKESKVIVIMIIIVIKKYKNCSETLAPAKHNRIQTIDSPVRLLMVTEILLDREV